MDMRKVSNFIAKLDVQKSDEESEKNRQNGNAQFKKKNLEEALEFYSLAVIHAPPNSPSLMTAYGNRSAVFAELEWFKPCMRDIERAINLCSKLPRSESLRAKLSRRLEAVKSVASQQGQNGHVKDQLPEIYGGPHTKVPSMSSKLEVCYSETKGRYVVAAETIPSGSVLVVEKAYGSVLLPQESDSRCHYCHRILPLDCIPCDKCIEVRFCNENCLSLAKKCHYVECTELKKLQDSGLAYLALKLLLETPVQSVWRTAHSETTKDYAVFTTQQSDFAYDCSSYAALNSLNTHADDVPKNDRKMYWQCTVALADLLKKRGYFHSALQQLSPSPPDIEDLLAIIGKQLERHIMQLICNAHAISVVEESNALERRINLHNAEMHTVRERAQKKIAAGVYPTASLFNHSCRPNIFSCFPDSRTIVLRAIESIPKGGELFNCYGPKFGRRTRQERQEALLMQYYFKCDCFACTDDSCMKKEREDCLFSCKKCNGPTDLREKEIFCWQCEIAETDVDKRCQELDEAKAALESVVRKSGSTLADVEKALTPLKGLLYEKSNELMLQRDEAAMWMCQNGYLEEAVALMVNNLRCVQFKHGDESIEAAEDVLKVIDVYRAINDRKSSEQLKDFIHLARRVFLTHYGKDYDVLKELW